MNNNPVSFPIISIVKLVKIRVLLDKSTHVQRHWKLSTETLSTYTPKAAGKRELSFKFQLFYLCW